MARYGPVAEACAPLSAVTQCRTEAGGYFASRGMVAFGQGKIIAGEVAFAPASGQRAHERRSAPRHRGINHLAAMILLSPLFAPANIIARFPQHFAPRTFLPNGNPEHAALAPTAYRRGRVRASLEKAADATGWKCQCRLIDPHRWAHVAPPRRRRIQPQPDLVPPHLTRAMAAGESSLTSDSSHRPRG